jgi:adenylate cyclase
MDENLVERRLAAIMAADVEGYSALMGADETGTLAALRKVHTEVFLPAIASHRGRLFKTMGDGFLVEFPSVVNAVACAVEIQNAMDARQGDDRASQRLAFRIGVNLGDVIVEGDDVFGDGVNVAARLESMAQPGGIAISATVRDHIGNRLNLDFLDLGEQSLKNIERPVRIYTLKPGRGALPRDATFSPPEMPSIAVLPLQNMSGDADQEFFTDGLTEDIITDLSNVAGLFVIARNSTFAYKRKPTDIRQIARDLSVRYVLEGSARRSAQKLRVNIQLVDAHYGAHLLAERFDCDMTDVFPVQDEITRRVVEAITGRLVHGSIATRRRPRNLEAYDLCLRSRRLQMHSKNTVCLAKENLERAIGLDPTYAEAHYELSIVHTVLWLIYGEDRAEHQKTALSLAAKALYLDPDDASAHASLAWALVHDHEWEEAEKRLESAIHINPNDADALAQFADFRTRTGQPVDGLSLMMRALRLNPQAPDWYFLNLGETQLELGQYADAVKTLGRPDIRYSFARRTLAAALALCGRQQEAKIEAAAFLNDHPDWSISAWSERTARKGTGLSRLLDGYRKAGLPD